MKTLANAMKKRFNALTKASKCEDKVVKECPKADCVGVSVQKKKNEKPTVTAKKASKKKQKRKRSGGKKAKRKSPKKDNHMLEWKCNVCRHTWETKGLGRKKLKVVLPKGSKPCPKCDIATFKNKGCNHMFCTVCRTQWNWSEQTL